MGGGLLQLVAMGAQDAYLSGNPQITFWKGMFKRHTNFAMEPFRANLTGQANWGVKHSVTLPRNADLLYSTYLEVVMPPGAVVNCDRGRLGYNLIKYVELEIGGQRIDRLYSEWLFLWDALTSEYTKSAKLSKMINAGLGTGGESIPASAVCNVGSGRPSLPTTLYIPLPFFYTRNPGAALPLIALQYHEVKINIQWQSVEFVKGDFTSTTVLPPPVQAALYVDYIYLDVEERRRMAQESHEYLIEQVQYNEDKGISSFNNRIDLTFNHPVKELVWVVQPSDYTNCKLAKSNGRADQSGTNGTRLTPFTYDVNAVYKQRLQINGQDRMEERFGDYYNKVQPYQHHTGTTSVYGNYHPEGQPGVYMYSFALKPEEHQPSGTCNFSRIDTATLVIDLAGQIEINPDTDKTFEVRVYAVNYNILRVMSGMAGLAYSN
jgi:hypothetical protein